MTQLLVPLAWVVNNDFKAARIITTREERVRAIMERDGLTVEVRELSEVPGRTGGWFCVIYRNDTPPDFETIHGYCVLTVACSGPNMAWLKASIGTLDSSAPIGHRFYCAAALLDPVERATLNMTDEMAKDMDRLANELYAQVLVGEMTEEGLGWLAYQRMGTGHSFSAYGFFEGAEGIRVLVSLGAGNHPSGPNEDTGHAWGSGVVISPPPLDTFEEVLPWAIRNMPKAEYLCPHPIESWHGDHKATRLIMQKLAARVLKCARPS